MNVKGNEKRDFPKNIRQIGEANKEKRIYLEDYAVAYLRQVKAAVLLGETVKVRGSRCWFVSGAVEIPDGDFTEENWNYVTEKAKESFGELFVVGWFLRAEEIPEELNEEDMHVYKEHFHGQEAILVVYNELEKEEAVYLTLDGFLRRQSGFYIYYEKNPRMQEYLIAKNDGRSVEKETVISDQAIKSFRRIIGEKKKSQSEETSGEESDNKDDVSDKKEETPEQTLPLKSFWRKEVQEGEKEKSSVGKNEKTPEETILLNTPKISSARISEKKQHKESPKVKTLHFLYTASTFMVLIILVIGVTMINNYDKMKEMEQTMAKMTEGAQVSAGVVETERETPGMQTTIIDVRTGETEILDGILEESESQDNSGTGQTGIDGSAQSSADGSGGGTDGSIQTGADGPGIGTNGSLQSADGSVQIGIDGSGTGTDGGLQSAGGSVQTWADGPDTGTDGSIQSAGGSIQTGADGPDTGTDGSVQSSDRGVQSGTDGVSTGMSNGETGNTDDSLASTVQAGAETSVSDGKNAEDIQAANAPARVSQAAYTIKFGDTLEDICIRYYGSTEKLQELCDINGITNPNAILPGEKLVLP